MICKDYNVDDITITELEIATCVKTVYPQIEI